MSPIKQKALVKRWVFSSLAVSLILLSLMVTFIVSSDNKSSIDRAEANILRVATNASYILENEVDKAVSNARGKNLKVDDALLNEYFSKFLKSTGSSFIYHLKSSDGGQTSLKKEGLSVNLNLLERILENNSDSQYIFNKSSFAQLSGRTYLLRNEKLIDSEGKSIGITLGIDINEIIDNIYSINNVHLVAHTNHKYPSFYNIVTEKGIYPAKVTNVRWINSELMKDIFFVSFIYICSAITLFYIFRTYLYSAYITPLRHLLLVLSSHQTPKEIDCPEAFGKLTKLVGNINSITKDLVTKTKSNLLESSAISSMQSAVAISNKKGKIIFSNTSFNDLFSLDEARGKDIYALINKHRSSLGELESNVLIQLSGKGSGIDLYQVNKQEVEGDSRNFIYEFQNINEVTELKKKLDAKFKIDELTSLLSRFHFNDIADTIISESNYEQSNYLALIDINDFKILNDSAGHDIGDLILMELATVVRQHSDENDIVGRMSGDEFVILFRDKSLDVIEQRLIKLYNAIKNYRIMHFDTKIGVSVSIGLTNASNSKDFIGVRSLLQQADLAVMTAKKNGFMFKLYDDNDLDITFYREAPQWINRIKNSIAHNTFELFVQEIQPFSKEKSLHVEVLLRMKDEKGGYYSPNRFFDVAEKFNLTRQIDEWVVVNAFKMISNGTLSDCKTSINLSADTIKDINSVEKIIYYSKLHKIDASRVVFEITETMAIDDLNTAIANINTLRCKGFSIALDDFGSGFSTFKYIQSIPADYIKIDGIFVKNAIRCERDRAIVANIVSIAHELNMHCVAEFVEDSMTMSLMQELEVDYTQGYYMHKPCPAKEWSKNHKKNILVNE